jgi:putative sigma-54 modulation protein
MKYTYACKKVSLNDAIKEYAEKKISKLERYYRDEDATAHITFAVEKDHLCTVEITIRGAGPLLRAQTEAPDGDMRGAIDSAVGYIERQILKNKTRLSKRMKAEAFPVSVPDDDFEVAEEMDFPIVRTKRFTVKPMSAEEAILQMNLLHHNFFVFRNSEDDALSIVYQRKAGGYGLIVTGDGDD